MSDRGFPKGFLWGAATAAYQVEGAAREGGRGESIWDRFCGTPGTVLNGDTGDVACDHYHRWRDDIENMRDLGLSSYRFSVAWPRIFPRGSGKPNRTGLDFYNALVDALLEARIEPAVTLYHWDLPQVLQDHGGWTSRDTASWFAEYAACMFTHLGDRVKTWMTINEPWVAAFLGHEKGLHAPGIRDYGKAVQAGHVLLLAHARAFEACRQLAPGGHRVGIALNLSPVYPYTDGLSDVEAAHAADGYLNRWFLDPLLRGSYPGDIHAIYTRHNVAPKMEAADMEMIHRSRPDFLGINYYAPWRTCASDAGGILGFENGVRKDTAVTEMGWEVFPDGLCELLLRLKGDYDNPAIMITENGAAYRDERVEKGQVQDDDRIEYLASHLREARRAVEHGVHLEGYFLWTLMDNFEWSFGYTRRFGITHVDFRTQARTWKKSAGWYQRVIGSNGAVL